MIQVNRIYLIFNRLVTKKFLVDTSEAKLEADKKAWQEYFIEYGNYQEKRKNLVQKYNDEIVKLQTDSPEYASKVAQRTRLLNSLMNSSVTPQRRWQTSLKIPAISPFPLFSPSLISMKHLSSTCLVQRKVTEQMLHLTN